VEQLGPILPFILVIAVFWLLIIRPQQRRAKAQRELQSSVQPGQEVMLTSGIFGTVRSAAEGKVDVEIAPGTVITVVAGAIAQIIPAEDITDEPGSAAGPEEQ
jgi:preprotein translocase subunit YajC